MRITLRIEARGLCLIRDLTSIVRAWRYEHAGFYANHPTAPPPNWEGLDPLDANALCGGARNVFLPAAEGLPVRGYRWLSSAGNDHRISMIAEKTAIIFFQGRRHGNRLAEFMEKYEGVSRALEYVTSVPDLTPWEVSGPMGRDMSIQDPPHAFLNTGIDSPWYRGYGQDNFEGSNSNAPAFSMKDKKVGWIYYLNQDFAPPGTEIAWGEVDPTQ